MNISIPDFCLVALIGTSGSGKSTFARRHFKPTEVISSDACRGLVEDDENSLDATADAFALVHTIAEIRLKRRKLVVIDATNVRQEDRAHLVRLARKYHALAVAIVLNPGEDICRERNKARPDRQFGPHVIRQQTANLKRKIRQLDREGFRYVHELRSPEAIDTAVIERTPLWTDRRIETGAFDIIGDVHGCAEADGLIRFAALPEMVPPVALLIHGAEDPSLAVFYPFAEYSPEWQAMLWASRQGRPVAFIDLRPRISSLAPARAPLPHSTIRSRPAPSKRQAESPPARSAHSASCALMTSAVSTRGSVNMIGKRNLAMSIAALKCGAPGHERRPVSRDGRKLRYFARKLLGRRRYKAPGVAPGCGGYWLGFICVSSLSTQRPARLYGAGLIGVLSSGMVRVAGWDGGDLRGGRPTRDR